MIDFEKAFDSVSWKFIDKVLLFFNFGQNFRNYFNCLNKNFKLCIMQHGFASSSFQIGRGCRQGDPISPYIFLLCVEILGILIRNEKEIKGIKINNKEIKISQYADDTGLFLDGSQKSLKNALSLLDQFAKYSGLKPNIDKCRCIWLGTKKHSQLKLCNDIPLIWSDSPFTYLGLVFSVDLPDMISLNYEKKLKDIRTLTSSWSKRLLSPIGKITVVKTIMLSRLTHLFISIPNPDKNFIHELEKLFFNFIWNNKNDKISRNQLCHKYEDGGLKMVNISVFIKSLKLSWMRRLILNNSILSDLFQSNTHSKIESLYKIGPEYIKNLIKNTSNQFWKDILYIWYEFRSIAQEKTNDMNFIYQELWHNTNIKIDNKTIYYKNWINYGIIYIYDLLNENGVLMSYIDFCRKFNFHPPIT